MTFPSGTQTAELKDQHRLSSNFQQSAAAASLVDYRLEPISTDVPTPTLQKVQTQTKSTMGLFSEGPDQLRLTYCLTCTVQHTIDSFTGCLWA